MKIVNRTLTVVAFAALMTFTIIAAELRNEDGKRYEVKVHEGSTTRNTYIDGTSTMLNICSDCEVEVVGVGKIRIKGSERAIIKDGRLTKQ